MIADRPVARGHGTRTWDAGLSLLVLFVAWELKRRYSTATASDLDWILRPTAGLVETLTQGVFVREDAAGYVSTEWHTVIAPACAGVNYLIVALTTLSVGFVGRMGTPSRKCAWLVASALLGYAATVVVNAVRISLGVALHRSGFATEWLSPEQVHRIEGVVVYLTSLWVLFLSVNAALSRRRNMLGRSLTVPTVAYVVVTLVVPLCNGSASRQAFWSHAVVVAGVTLTLGLLAAGARTMLRRHPPLHEALRLLRLSESSLLRERHL